MTTLGGMKKIILAVPLFTHEFDDFKPYYMPFNKTLITYIPLNRNSLLMSHPHATEDAAFRGHLDGSFVLVALVVIAFLGGWFCHQFFGKFVRSKQSIESLCPTLQQAWTTIDQELC